MSKDFLTDDEMNQLESSAPQDSSPDFLSDDEMSAMESQAPSSGTSFVADQLDPLEAAKTLAGGAFGYGAGKAASPIAEKGADILTRKVLDPVAEDLAYRGAGGYSGTKAGKELNKKMIFDKVGKSPETLEEIADSGVFDNGVTNRSVGREILDNKLLGPGGLGFKSTNLGKAAENLSKKSAPTNAMLESISEYPVSQDGIFGRMKELLGYDQLNPTVPNQANIKGKLDGLNDKSFDDIETPMQAERAKRDLQKVADFADPEKTVKNAMNVAQATARKEAVEQAVDGALGPEKLEEFKRLKAQSGSAGVAKDLLEDVYDKSQKPFSGFNSITGSAIDFLKQRGAGITAAATDTISKGVKSGAKALGPGLGTLIGATAGAAAADDQTDAADFIPGLDQASAAGSAFDDKQLIAEDQARKNYKASPASQDRAEYLRQNIQDAPEAFRNGFAYKQAEQELKTLTDGSKALNTSSPDQLMELSNQFKNIKGADKFVAPLENAAQSSSEEERKARLFGLYQQPAFRQLLKKGNNSEE